MMISLINYLRKASFVYIENAVYFVRIRYSGLFAFMCLIVLASLGSCGGDDEEVIPNKAPVANAGSDQTVNTGATVTLDGSGSSDPDSNDITYQWTAKSGNPATVTLSSATVASPTFTAPSTAGTYTFTLVVNDGTAKSSPDEVQITINAPPVANAGSDQTVNTGATVTLDGSGSSDPDSDAITYQWTAKSGNPATVTLSSATVASPTFTAPSTVGTYTFTLVVNDGRVDSSPDEVQVTVSASSTNTPPVANAGSDQTVNTGATVTLDGSGSSDPDSDAITYQWTAKSGNPATVTLSSATVASPTFTAPSTAGTYTFTLVVNDGTANSSPDEVQVTVNASSSNTPPVANAGSDQTANTGATVTLDGSGSSDPDSDPITYQWTAKSGNPATVTLSSATVASPTFTAPGTAGTYTFTLVVNDGTANSSPDEVQITVSASSSNTPPVANAGSDQTVNTGATVTLDGSGSSDPDSDPITYQWTAKSGNPATVTLSSATVASPTFTAPGTAGTYTFTLVVNDGTVDSSPDEVQVTVNAAASPTITFWPHTRANATLTSVAYGSNTFVAVGGFGTSDASDRSLVLYSTDDGTSWTEASSPITNAEDTWGEVIFANNQFITVGENGAVATSSDGITWTKVTTQTAAMEEQAWEWNSVAYNNNNYVYVGNSGRYATAAFNTPSTVTVGTSVVDDDWHSVVYGSDKFVTVGKDGKIGYSTDGTSWTFKTIDNSNFRRFRNVTYGSAGYIATVNGGSIQHAVSSNGIDWTLPSSSASLQGGKFVNSRYVMLGRFEDTRSGSESSRDKVYFSTDLTFEASEAVNVAEGGTAPFALMHSVAFGNNKYVVVGNKIIVIELP